MRKNSCQLSPPEAGPPLAEVVSCQKKQFILFATCYLLLASLLGSCAKREIKNIDSKGKNIICLGDSITFGYGAEAGEDYPSELAKMTDFSIINAGIDGDTSTEALKRIESDVLEREPLLVIIEFGGNDFLRKIPKEVTINNIKYMVDSIQNKGAMVAILDISAGFFLKEYRQALALLAQEKRAIFIPSVLRGVITNPNLKSDFIHPNGNGYKVVAQRVYQAISPFLNQHTLVKKFKK